MSKKDRVRLAEICKRNGIYETVSWILYNTKWETCAYDYALKTMVMLGEIVKLIADKAEKKPNKQNGE